MRRAVGLVMGVVLAFSLASPRVLASPFIFRTGLPALAEGQYYRLLDGGYAVQAELHKDEVSIVDLRTGATMWRLDSTDHLQVHDQLGGTIVVTTQAYSDSQKQSMITGKATTSSYDLATGRKLWSRSGDYLWHRAGPVVPIVNADETGVGVDARTGQVVWQTPSLRHSAMLVGGNHWQVEKDGTVSVVDLLTGAVSVRGKASPSARIGGWNERYVLMEEQVRYPPEGGTPLPSTTTLHDRAYLAQLATYPVKDPMRLPPDIWLCGAMVCSRGGGVDLKVFDHDGAVRWTREQFLLDAVIARPDGQRLLYGKQFRAGIVPPGKKDNDSNQLLDPESGNVVVDLGDWRFVGVESGRFWVSLYPDRHAAQPPASLGFVDLRPGSAMTVQGIISLDGAFEDCDLRDSWLLCSDLDRDDPPVAVRLAKVGTQSVVA